ncbi:hypothetical protein BSG1_06247 [Bacillus sp. SG-1]|nr:hypothetical protein BSG1_06247 [Bacillus sp. SG-1]
MKINIYESQFKNAHYEELLFDKSKLAKR